MIKKINLDARHSLVGKVLSNFTIAILFICIANFTAQGGNTENGHTNSIAAETAALDNEGNSSYCKKPTFHPCMEKRVLDFKQLGYNWSVNSMQGTYTVGDQTFEININDPDGIFGALHEPIDPDDLGSYENGTGIAVGINPLHRDDEMAIVYKLSKVSDYVAFTIRDLDKKYYQGSSKQIEKVCIYGSCDGEPVIPIVTSLCGSVKVKDNCAVATTDSHKSKKDESIRVIFDQCVDEIKIVYGNAYNAPQNPSYSKIYIGDDIGFGTALCHGECKPCTVEPSCTSSADFAGCTIFCINPDGTVPVSVDLIDPGSGDNSTWVVTDLENNIVEVTENLPVVLTEGFYNFYYINWNGELSASLNEGANLIDIIDNSECAALGKSECVEVKNCCTVEPSLIFLPDAIGAICINTQLEVEFIDGTGQNSIWVVTDESGNIINTTTTPLFNVTEIGAFLIWNLTWNGNLNGLLTEGSNLQEIVENSLCAALSNSISRTGRECCTASPAAISLEGGDETLNVCVNDETLESANFIITNAGNGNNSLWVITDENGIISSNLAIAPNLNLYDAPLGTMLIWLVTWDGSLSAPPNVFTNINQIIENSECAALSNPIVIVKECCCPYSIEFSGVDDCEPNLVSLSASLIVDENLILDDGTVVCEIDGFAECSSEPIILDPNGERVLGPVDRNTPGIFTATVDECRCAMDVGTTIAELVQIACGDALPVAPIPQVMNITENSADISCQHENPVIIEFRKSGDITFSSFNLQAGNDMILLTGLESCTYYEYRSRLIDTKGNSITCAIQTLTTDGCRNINIEDINLRSLNVEDRTAVLTWDNMPGCVYTLYFRIKGQTEWKTYNTTIPYVIAFGLNPCTDYEWALRVSEDDLVSDISSTQSISTSCQGPRLSNPKTDDVKIGNLNDLQNIELDLHVNPGSKMLTINFLGLPAKSVGVYKVSGQLVKSLNVNNHDLSTIDISDLKAGMYILVTTFDSGTTKNKFIVYK